MRSARWLLAFALVSASGCGYHLGFPGRPGVRTVYVGLFENRSRRRELEFELSRAVIEEIYTRTPWRVVGDPSAADLVLSGAIEAWNERTSVEGPSDEPLSGVSRLRVGLNLERRGHETERMRFEVLADFEPQPGVDAVAGITDATLRPVRAELVRLAAERVVMALERPAAFADAGHSSTPASTQPAGEKRP